MEDPVENDALLPEKWFPEDAPVEAPPHLGRRAAIYARYSFLGKRESSIERQAEVCASYIRANQFLLVDTYADRARTGTTKTGREELQRLQEDAGKGKFDIVVVEDVDRLGRALEVTVEIWNELRKVGIELHDSELGRLTPGQLGAKAGASDEERSKIVRRNREGKRRKTRQGEWVGITCFGYRRKLVDAKSARSVVEVDESEAAIVREIFELFDKGISTDRIATILNARPAEDRGNRHWTGCELRGSGKYGTGYLRRLRYAGLSVHGRTNVKKTNGKYKVSATARRDWAVGRLRKELIIVDRDLFERVQERLNKDHRGPREPTWTVKHYALGGLLYCASCGGKMTPTLKRADGHPRAMCNRARNPNSIKPGKMRCENSRSTSIDQLDDMVREVLRAEIVHPRAFQAFVAEYNRERKLLADKDNRDAPSLRRELCDLEAEREDLWKNRHSFGDEFVEERAPILTRMITEKKRKLDDVESRPKGELEFKGDVSKAIASDIDAVFMPEFDSKTATGALIVARLRSLIKKVVVDLTDDETSIEIHCDVNPLVANVGSSELIKFKLSRPRTGHGPLHAELRRIASIVEAGTYAISDPVWSSIAPLLPRCIARGKRGESDAVDPRIVIEAALLHLHEDVPLSRMPAEYGSAPLLLKALKRLSSSGAWEVVIGVLRRVSPGLVPEKSTNMFSTIKGRYSSSLKGLPEIRARHGIEMEAGKHAPSDEEWALVQDLVPEEILAARIDPRDFFHGILYMLKTGSPISHMPIQLGSQTFFTNSLHRLVSHGFWDRLVERINEKSPSTLEAADLSRLDRYPRSTKERRLLRKVIAKSSDRVGVPSHMPTDEEWELIKHLFPPELLYVGDRLAINNPRVLAHAVFYRAKEKIPYSAFPQYFGDPRLVALTVRKFVFHHLWERMISILQAESPETLDSADMLVFSRYKRGKRHRYAHLMPETELDAPAHAPTDAQWALVKHLLPPEILMIAGRPAILEPRKFLHAIMYMTMERVKFGGLPRAYFGSADDIRFAMRKLVRHHYWDSMVGLFKHFDEEWAEKADLTLFDQMDRSKNQEPEFRMNRVKRLAKPLSSPQKNAAPAL